MGLRQAEGPQNHVSSICGSGDAGKATLFLCRILTDYLLWASNAKDAFSSLIITPLCPVGEHHCKLQNQSEFFTKCQRLVCCYSSDLSWLRSTLYWKLVWGDCIGPILWAAQLVSIQVVLFVVLGNSSKLPQKPWAFVYLLIDLECTLSQWCDFQSVPGRYALLSPMW